MAAPATPTAERCPWCGRPLRLVFVHGHEQCAYCGAPVLPCCEGTPLGPGEACPLPEPPATEPAAAQRAAAPKTGRTGKTGRGRPRKRRPA